MATTRRKPGGLFVKPGIGVLRRADDTPYNHSKPYEIANRGKWDVKRSRDAIEFRHTLSEPAHGVRLRLHQNHPRSLGAGRR